MACAGLPRCRGIAFRVSGSAWAPVFCRQRTWPRPQPADVPSFLYLRAWWGGGGGHMARAASRGSPPPFLLKGASIPLWPGGLFSVTLNHAGLSLGGHLPAFSRWLHRLAPQGTRKYSHSDFYQQLDQGSLGFFCHASRRSPSLFPFLYSVSASCGCLSKPSQTLGLKIRQIYHLTLVGGQKSELGLR